MELTKLQKQTLAAIGQSDLAHLFYWTGGTLLAAQYLKHRISFDLDFFSEDLIEEEFVLAAVNRIKKSLALTKVERQIIRNRQQYQLQKAGERLNLEFVYYPFRPLIKPKRVTAWPVAIDSLKDIAVNKTRALYERAEPKDVIDIWCIHQKNGWDMQQLAKLADKKFGVPIDYPTLVSRALDAAARLEDAKPLLPKTSSIKKMKQDIDSLFRQSGVRKLSTLLV